MYIYIYIYKHDLVLNKLQELICEKMQPTNQPFLFVGMSRDLCLQLRGGTLIHMAKKTIRESKKFVYIFVTPFKFFLLLEQYM